MGNSSTTVQWIDKNVKLLCLGALAVGVAALTVIAFNSVANTAAADGTQPGPVPTFGASAATPTPALSIPAGSDVLLIGDSYAEGTGASSTATAWPALLGTQQGWNMTVDGIGGTGFTWGGGADGSAGQTFSARLAQRATDPNLTPELVILEGGQNDYRADAKDLTAAVAADVDAAKAAWPNAAVIVLGPAAPEPLASSIERMDTSIEAGAQRAGAYSINPRAGQWFTTANSPEFDFDGAHVNDGGHSLIAQKIGEAMAAFGEGRTSF